MLRLRHAYRLGRDVVGLASVNGAWWVIPIFVVIVLLAVAVTAANAALPYAVYTLF